MRCLAGTPLNVWYIIYDIFWIWINKKRFKKKRRSGSGGTGFVEQQMSLNGIYMTLLNKIRSIYKGRLINTKSRLDSILSITFCLQRALMKVSKKWIFQVVIAGLRKKILQQERKYFVIKIFTLIFTSFMCMCVLV